MVSASSTFDCGFSWMKSFMIASIWSRNKELRVNHLGCCIFCLSLIHTTIRGSAIGEIKKNLCASKFLQIRAKVENIKTEKNVLSFIDSDPAKKKIKESKQELTNLCLWLTKANLNKKIYMSCYSNTISCKF